MEIENKQQEKIFTLMTELAELKSNLKKTQTKFDHEEQQTNHYKIMASDLAEKTNKQDRLFDELTTELEEKEKEIESF